MAYILGYIATDGCVSEERVLRLGLTIKDESLLYKIKKIMEFGGPVLRRISRASGKEYESSYMNIYNREIVKDLKELGIVQNKTFILFQKNMSLILLGALLTEMAVSGDKAEKNVKIIIKLE